jgi:hypothetical protein
MCSEVWNPKDREKGSVMVTFAISAVVFFILLVVILLAFFRPGVLTSLFGTAGDLIETGVNNLTGRAAVHRIQARINQKSKELAGSVKSIESVQTEIQRLKRSVAESESDERRLRARIDKALDKNTTDGQAEAQDMAKELAAVLQNKTNDQTDLEGFTNQYNDIVAGFHDMLGQVEEAKKEAGRDSARLQTANVKARGAELAMKMNVSFGADGDIADLREQVKKQIDAANAKTVVANDINVKARQERSARQEERDAAGKALLEQIQATRTPAAL